MPAIRLGLIGDVIATSKSPALHRLAGKMLGLEVSYDLLVPKDLGLGFDAVFERTRREGYRGLNITYPYKERVFPRLKIADPEIVPIAACNTVLFDNPPAGANTDYSGFIAAFRNHFGVSSPGVVAMAGAGGVGRALAFALGHLGAKALQLFDVHAAKAQELARAVAVAYPQTDVSVAASGEAASESADGLVNCTPLGMSGANESAFPAPALRGRRWAFDAVYTPIDTRFMIEARAAGLAVMSGYELYFHQGIDAFRLFTGLEVDAAALRKALAAQDPEVRNIA